MVQAVKSAAPSKPLKTSTVEENYALFDKISGGKYPTLKKIGECESGFRQVPNSSGASSAFGIFQLIKAHDARARKLGFADRKSLEANIKTAISIYNEQGTTPWNASKHCWY